MEAEFTELGKKIKSLIQRVRELEEECARLGTRIDELEELKNAAAERITGLLDRLEQPE